MKSSDVEESMAESSPAWVYVGELVLVIFLSTIYEKGQDYILESLSRKGPLGASMKRIANTLVNEVMILGFISLLVFITMNSDLGAYISTWLYPPEQIDPGETALAESFETVHMIIFSVMVCFILQCAIIMYQVHQESRKWEKWESLRVGAEAHVVVNLRTTTSTSPESDDTIANMLQAAGYLDAFGNKRRDLCFETVPLRLLLSKRGVLDVLQFRTIRHEFIFGHDDATEGAIYTLPQQHTCFFRMSDYFGAKTGALFAELLKVDVSTWVVGCLLSLLLPLAMSYGEYWYVVFLAACALLNPLAMLAFGTDTCRILIRLTPELPSTDPLALLELLRGTSAEELQREHQRSEAKRSAELPPAPQLQQRLLTSYERCMTTIDVMPESHLLDSSPFDKQVSDTPPARVAMPAWQQRQMKRWKDDAALSIKSYKACRKAAQATSPKRSDYQAKCSISRRRNFSVHRPWYLQLLQRLRFIELKAAPNPQEAVFLLHEAGPQVMKQFLELSLFLQSVTCALFFSVFFSQEHWDAFQYVAFTVGMAAPLINLCFLVPRTVSKLAIVTSILYMKDERLCDYVIEQTKKAHMFWNLKLLEIARIEGKLKRLGGDDRKLNEADINKYRGIWDSLSRKKRAEARKLFEMFDEDDSHSISESELTGVLLSLNLCQTSVAYRSALELFKMIDVDQSGLIEWKEFQVLMAMVLHPCSEDEQLEDLKLLFRMFDVDEGGSISIGELTEGFQKIGLEMTEESMAGLVFQVLRNTRQNLTEDDFVRFMHGLEELAETEQ